MSLPWYHANSPRIIAEIIDGEAIAIDTETGTYFSMQGTAAFVWQLLATGVQMSDMLEAVQQQYQCAQTEIEPCLAHFLTQLEAASLAARSDDAARSSKKPDQVEPPSPGERPSFTVPELNRYEDMQEFLLVDPIHEVNDDGWPSRND